MNPYTKRAKISARMASLQCKEAGLSLDKARELLLFELWGIYREQKKPTKPEEYESGV